MSSSATVASPSAFKEIKGGVQNESHQHHEGQQQQQAPQGQQGHEFEEGLLLGGEEGGLEEHLGSEDMFDLASLLELHQRQSGGVFEKLPPASLPAGGDLGEEGIVSQQQKKKRSFSDLCESVSSDDQRSSDVSMNAAEDRGEAPSTWSPPLPSSSSPTSCLPATITALPHAQGEPAPLGISDLTDIHCNAAAAAATQQVLSLMAEAETGATERSDTPADRLNRKKTREKRRIELNDKFEELQKVLDGVEATMGVGGGDPRSAAAAAAEGEKASGGVASVAAAAASPPNTTRVEILGRAIRILRRLAILRDSGVAPPPDMEETSRDAGVEGEGALATAVTASSEQQQQQQQQQQQHTLATVDEMAGCVGVSAHVGGTGMSLPVPSPSLLSAAAAAMKQQQLMIQQTHGQHPQVFSVPIPAGAGGTQQQQQQQQYVIVPMYMPHPQAPAGAAQQQQPSWQRAAASDKEVAPGGEGAEGSDVVGKPGGAQCFALASGSAVPMLPVPQFASAALAGDPETDKVTHAVCA